MLVKIVLGSGAPGKLWRGTQLRYNHDHMIVDELGQAYPGDYALAWAEVVTCPDCGATTRLFRATPPAVAPKEGHAPIPALFISTGGVESLRIPADVAPELTFWNWSARRSGVAILTPKAAICGPLWPSTEDHWRLPAAAGYHEWVETYRGLYCRDITLLERSGSGLLGVGQGLPDTRRTRMCPPCARRRRPPVVLADDGNYQLTYRFSDDRYVAGCRNFTREEALAHWGQRSDFRARLFYRAIAQFSPRDRVLPGVLRAISPDNSQVLSQRGEDFLLNGERISYGAQELIQTWRVAV